MLKYLTLVIGSVAAASVPHFPSSGLTAQSIYECSPLAPHPPPSSVHDLRPDDIKVIAAIGDSVTAGMLSKNVNTPYISFEQFVEYRGSSWLNGGDRDANSVAKYVEHYSPGVYGASIGSKPARLCPETLFCFDTHHDPEIDVLNAAQSGAVSSQMVDQVNYLTERIGVNSPFATDYKMINVFIGFNDASVSCLSPYSVSEYKANVTANLNKLIDSIDYAFINIVGLMHFNELVYTTDKLPGYKKSFRSNKINMLDYECYCCEAPGGIEYIGEKINEFNKALVEIVDEQSSKLLAQKKNVAVVFQPMDPVIETVPPHALSNADGYHPNVVGYKYLSRALWNQMFRSREEKVVRDAFDPEVPIYCPTVKDRFRTDQNKV